MDHHAPEDSPVPQHLLEEGRLAPAAAFAEQPLVDAEYAEAQSGQRAGVGLGLQEWGAFDQLAFAPRVVAAVCVVVKDAGDLPRDLPGPGKIGGHRLEAVQVEDNVLEQVAAAVARLPEG